MSMNFMYQILKKILKPLKDICYISKWDRIFDLSTLFHYHMPLLVQSLKLETIKLDPLETETYLNRQEVFNYCQKRLGNKPRSSTGQQQSLRKLSRH